MRLVSINLADALLHRFKAPPGEMFIVESISFSNYAAVATGVLVLDYFVEDEIDPATLEPSDMLALFRPDTAGTNFQLTGINHKTKFLTIFGNAAPSTVVIVFGRLEKASRTELIIEWFRKGR